MEENWTYYCGKKVIYEVSNEGNVKRDGKLIDFSNVPDDEYYRTSSFCVHRAVAELYVPNPDNKPCVDHIDGNKHNNKASNLRWVTYSENMRNEQTYLPWLESTRNRKPRKHYKVSDEGRASIAIANKKRYEDDPTLAERIAEQNRGRKFMNNGEFQKQIKQEEIEHYLELGWTFGMVKKNKTTKWLNNGLEEKLVEESLIKLFLKNNWKYGRLKKHL